MSSNGLGEGDDPSISLPDEEAVEEYSEEDECFLTPAKFLEHLVQQTADENLNDDDDESSAGEELGSYFSDDNDFGEWGMGGGSEVATPGNLAPFIFSAIDRAESGGLQFPPPPPQSPTVDAKNTECQDSLLRYSMRLRHSSRTQSTGGYRPGSMIFNDTFSKIKTIAVAFILDNDGVSQTVILECQGNDTVSRVKTTLWNKLQSLCLLTQNFENKSRFSFGYRKNGVTYEILDEGQLFQTLYVVNYWESLRLPCGELRVLPRQRETEQEKTLREEISRIVGYRFRSMGWGESNSESEFEMARRKLYGVFRGTVEGRDPELYAMETWTTNSRVPPHIERFLSRNKLFITIHSGKAFTKFSVAPDMTADEILEMFFRKIRKKSQLFGLEEESRWSEFVFKLCGRNYYFHGHHGIIDFVYVRQCICKQDPVHLVVVPKLDVTLDDAPDVDIWNLIDPSTGMTGSHSELSSVGKDHQQTFVLSLWDIRRHFHVRVCGLDFLPSDTRYNHVVVQVGLYHGTKLLCPKVRTGPMEHVESPRWYEWLRLGIATCDIPRAAHLTIVVCGTNYEVADRAARRRSMFSQASRYDTQPPQTANTLYVASVQLLDFKSILRTGVHTFPLWKIAHDESDGNHDNNPLLHHMNQLLQTKGPAVAQIELETYAHSVAYPSSGWEQTPLTSVDTPPPDDDAKRQLDACIQSDPLTPLGDSDKTLIWNYRQYCKVVPEALPKFLISVDWSDRTAVCETYQLLTEWAEISLNIALELLDCHFVDDRVRTLAVKCLEHLPNDKLTPLLLQLIQVVKFEPYHDSPLARFLLKRALQSKIIGHYFFWFLRAEMDSPVIADRFALLLEAYLRGCGGAMLRSFSDQVAVLDTLMEIAPAVKLVAERVDVERAIRKLHRCLDAATFPDSFACMYDPTVVAGKLIVKDCKVMDSKKKPLWLEFENGDPTAEDRGGPIRMIFKHGDDLRQDMLTLQMLRIMDDIWQSCGLDLWILPYGCIATGSEVGVIEVVKDAKTISTIQRCHASTLTMPFRDDVLMKWLEEENRRPEEFEAAVNRFMLSCAGYCVATYVLGIGDRHNDNIMVSRSGNIFHIDFGHFLGNIKRFAGVRREWVPFVLTPDLVYVLGGRGSDLFDKFQENCILSYLFLREHARFFVNLFSLMKLTGIPELRGVNDINYVKDVLTMNESTKHAREHFLEQIQRCLDYSWTVQVSWMTHMMAH